MNPHSIARFSRGRPAALLLALAGSLAVLSQAQAQPTIVSTVPANFATGVSPTAPVVITFSAAMDTSATTATFIDPSNPLTPLPTTDTWSADQKTLTCTPAPPFPSPSKMIVWTVDGQDALGNSLQGNNGGFFTTGTSGGGGTGTGTNAITTFSAGTIWLYDQNSANAPTPDPEASYGFSAGTGLASNRTATAISLTLPTGGMTNLNRSPLAAEDFYLVAFATNLTTFQAAYPNGNYIFNVQATTSNQQVTVNLPASLTQPNAPHVANYPAAQAVNATQPFTLNWDAFTAATASNFITIEVLIPGTGAAAFSNTYPHTATAAVIPAGTLQAGTNYDAYLGFYNATGTTNASYATVAFRATSTRFIVTTTGGAATGPLVLTNAVRSSGVFSFQILSSAGQTISVEYSSTLKSGSWTPLLTTNSPAGAVQITDPQSVGGGNRYYRARKGP